MKNEYRHIPVLLDEVLESFQIFNHSRKRGMVFVDCTLGGAGHSLEVSKMLTTKDLLIGIDQDAQALEVARERLTREGGPKLKFVNDNFGNLDEILLESHVSGVDGVLMDLGLSSFQIDTPERGFSFKENCALDMRMSPNKQSLSAANIVASYSEEELNRVFKDYGEEKFARKIAKEICKVRENHPITTSNQLVDVIKTAIPAATRRSGGHPAKRVFQALRIEVNGELQMLEKGLDSALRWLNPGGVISIISYHSLEDKRVKDAFNALVDRCTCPPDLPVCMCGRKPIIKVLTKHPITPTDAEIENNSRSRSAKLRVAQKLFKGSMTDANNAQKHKKPV